MLLRDEDPTVPYLVVLAGETVGRVIQLGKSVSIEVGRSPACGVFLDCENISRSHARIDLDAQGEATVIDMQSTNGTMVNGKKVPRQHLLDGDRVCFGNVILRFSHQDGLEYDFQQSLYDKATKDALTGAFNKRFLMESLDREFAFHQRQGQPLSVLMLDLDDFKRINNNFGHVHGDIVLKEMCKALLKTLRKEDLLARFDGEEFVVLFRKTSRQTALEIAHKIWNLVSELLFETLEGSFRVTATIGVATLEGESFASADVLLMAADQNLYVGKKAGKNRIVG